MKNPLEIRRSTRVSQSWQRLNLHFMVAAIGKCLPARTSMTDGAVVARNRAGPAEVGEKKLPLAEGRPRVGASSSEVVEKGPCQCKSEGRCKQQ